MVDRAEGYYWIIDGKDVPEVAAWFEGHWWLSGFDEAAIDTQVIVLSERLTPPPLPE